jgi:plasmid maintenance system antidote protein VapI
MEQPHPLRTWRKSRPKPLTQGQLAGLIGVVPSQVSQIENRLKGCSLDVALKIRDLAGDAVPLESLLPEAAE